MTNGTDKRAQIQEWERRLAVARSNGCDRCLYELWWDVDDAYGLHRGRLIGLEQRRLHRELTGEEFNQVEYRLQRESYGFAMKSLIQNECQPRVYELTMEYGLPAEELHHSCGAVDRKLVPVLRTHGSPRHQSFVRDRDYRRAERQLRAKLAQRPADGAS